MSAGRVPPAPRTQAEWEAHWAFYELTVKQRDLAWRQQRRLEAVTNGPTLAIISAAEEVAGIARQSEPFSQGQAAVPWSAIYKLRDALRAAGIESM